jgi:transposase
MSNFIRIGVDLAKKYFQIHALQSEDGRATTRKLSRRAMRKFFSEMTPCLVGMEAARRIIGRGNFRRWVTRCA